MKVKLRAVTSVLSATALVGSVLLGVANPASAAITLPWGTDANELGQIHFYNASGTEVRTGPVDGDPFALYAVATTNDPQTENTTATLYAYTPVTGQLPVNWSGEQLSGTTTFPVVSAEAPTVVKSAGAHRPVVTNDTTAHGAINLSGYIADVPNNDTTTAYAGLYELRIKTAGNDPKYWAAVIHVASGTWSVVYPDAAVTQHNSSLTISKSTTINYGTSTKTSTTLKDTTTGQVIKSSAVKLQRKSGASWVTVSTVNTSSTTGIASATVKPNATTTYRWFFAGNTAHKTATSASQTVSVRQTISAHSTKTSVPHNVTWKIYGTVQPASSGQHISLQRLSGTTWHTISTATITNQKLPNGSTTVGFVFSVKQGTKGTFKYRAYKAATSTLVAGTSSTLTVKVT